MHLLLKIWRVYRWVAIAVGTLFLLGLICLKTYKAITDPSEVPADTAFIEQQLGLPCAGLSLSRATWDKESLCLAASASPTEAWVEGLTAAGWVEQPALPGVRRVFERGGFTLALLIGQDKLLLYPTWVDRKDKPISTPEDVRKTR